MKQILLHIITLGCIILASCNNKPTFSRLDVLTRYEAAKNSLEASRYLDSITSIHKESLLADDELKKIGWSEFDISIKTNIANIAERDIEELTAKRPPLKRTESSREDEDRPIIMKGVGSSDSEKENNY